MRTLYLGSGTGTSRHRSRALERLGHDVTLIDPCRWLPEARGMNSWVHHTGGCFVDEIVSRRIGSVLKDAAFDLIWVDGGVLLTPALVKQLRERCILAVSYNIDDPFGRRDPRKWRNYLRSLGFYDLVVVVRDCNLEEALESGAQNAMRVYMSADETAHAPRILTDEDQKQWGSGVLFIGTWMPERGPLLARLIKLGVPLSIIGDRWHKAPEWNDLRPHWRGPGIYSDDDYARAVQCAGVCLGFLSKGNRDQSTTRSFEIPYLGGVLCAERTPEHLQLYRENEEALFWVTPEECAESCRYVLSNSGFRQRIATAGRVRCIRNRTTNQAVLETILNTAIHHARNVSKLAS